MSDDTLKQLAEHFEGVLKLLGYDTKSEGLRNTPMRVAKFWRDFHAKGTAPVQMTAFREDGVVIDQMVIVGPIPFVSMCEHHMLPFLGRAVVAYIPSKDAGIGGLSKFARVVTKHSRMLQTQERMTQQIAQAIEVSYRPYGVGVYAEARHMCMEIRGVEMPGVLTTTTSLKGALSGGSSKAEFLQAAQKLLA